MKLSQFSKTIDILHRALDASSLRYTISSNNLANAEVPNFKRTDVNFESQLKRALDTEKYASQAFQMKTTNDRHIKSETYIDYRTVEPRRVIDYTSTVKANGNNVDAEEEAMLILKTQMQYQLMTQLVSFQFSQVKSVLK
ncbi:MAG: flagellar basal body rod protein FlgB [Spirochaetaceae bacterium]|nr:flagellar basal body rod protein FlgB [Spirochaetaceae bacterium]